MSKPTVHVMTESGVVLEMDWPLNEYQGKKLAKGEIWCVNPVAGERVPAPGGEAPTPVAATSSLSASSAETGTDATPSVMTRPKNAAVKAEWVEWAVYVGQDRALAEALSKDDLIDMFGDAKPEGSAE